MRRPLTRYNTVCGEELSPLWRDEGLQLGVRHVKSAVNSSTKEAVVCNQTTQGASFVERFASKFPEAGAWASMAAAERVFGTWTGGN